MSEARILHDIMVALGARDDLLLMRRSVGRAFDAETGRCISFGTPGEADLQGVQLRRCSCGAKYGQAFALEAKAPAGRQRPSQRAWQAAWERCGGLYRIVRSVDEATLALYPDGP